MHRLKPYCALILLLPIFILIVLQLHVKHSAGKQSSPGEMLLRISFVNTNLEKISADPSNKVMITAAVADSNGLPAGNVPVSFTVAPSGCGEIVPLSQMTNKFGECPAYFIPDKNLNARISGTREVSVTASIKGGSVRSSLEFGIIPVPVVFIHGYLSSSAVFDRLEEFLSSKGLECIPFDYASSEGVKPAVLKLDDFLRKKEVEYLNRGILIGSFDVIAHSMGGIVARYYTAGSGFRKAGNVRKLILLSVPNHGSELVPLVENYLNDEGIRNMAPQSVIFTEEFPSMINKGLNNTLEVGNLIDKNDEVVSIGSARLDEWGIKTELFNSAQNSSYNLEPADQSPAWSTNHLSVLNNRLVFERLLEMLDGPLPNPKILK